MNECLGKLWITGAGGMLGQDLVSMALAFGWQVVATDRDVDITHTQAVQQFLQKESPQMVVNCAAYTAVDQAESESEGNTRINADGPGVLGDCTAALSVGVIHVSTDYVLSGSPPHPLTENAPYAPMNAYGRAKAEGEKRLMAANPQSWIVRTAWLYGIHGHNFVKTMLRLMAEKDRLTVVGDQQGNPTWTQDLSRAILTIAQFQRAPGVYHFTGGGITSWYGFACEIQRQALELGLLQRAIPIESVPSSQYPTPARRPHWSALDKTKISQEWGVSVPDWQQSLAQYLQLEKVARG